MSNSYQYVITKSSDFKPEIDLLPTLRFTPLFLLTFPNN